MTDMMSNPSSVQARAVSGWQSKAQSGRRIGSNTRWSWRRAVGLTAATAALVSFDVSGQSSPSTPKVEEVHGRGQKVEKLRLPNHSFSESGELTRLNHWKLTSATIPSKGRFMLYPASKEVHGFAWNNEALLTNNYEINFTVDVPILIHNSLDLI